MRKIISSFFPLMTCIVLLAHVVIPHHCHDYKEVCLLMSTENQCCHQTCHNHGDMPCEDADNPSTHSGSCIVDDFFFPKSNTELNIFLDFDILDFCCCIPTLFNIEPCDNENIVKYRQWNFFHEDPVVVELFGMRAPPVC